jgi:hypothetical protein
LRIRGGVSLELALGNAGLLEVDLVEEAAPVDLLEHFDHRLLAAPEMRNAQTSAMP